MPDSLSNPIAGGEGCGGEDKGASFGPNYSSKTKPIHRLGPSGEYFSRGPSWMRRLTLCKLSLCETFKTASDENGVSGKEG